MLQRLLELKPEVLCDTVHGALTGTLQQLLVTGYAAVDLIGSSTDGPTADARDVFDRVRTILRLAHFIDAEAPVSETVRGGPRVRVPNPYHRSLHLPARLRISAETDPVAVILHTFLVLRVRYQVTTESAPKMRLEVSSRSDAGLDLLYLVGDCFTERYPITAELAVEGEKAILTLTGEPPLIVGGLTWARDDYVRCRDVCLLIRPLREAFDGPSRPLVVPREVRGPLGEVRVRLPQQARMHTKWLRWLSTLQELRHPAGGDIANTSGPVGEHLCVVPKTGGYIAAGGGVGTNVILPVRCLAATSPTEIIVPEGDDGSIAITFEAIGGAREIGANSYHYIFGHRGLLIDAGFDATRDGWLGLPALERVSRLDAVVLTHAHLDHIGAVATLVAAFPNVPIYCTRATLAVLFPQLTDSANVGNIRFAHTGETPALSHGLVDSIRVEQFRVLDYRVRSEVPEIPGLSLEFYDAGHIIGSACAKFEFSGITILHTGDISVEDQHLLHGMPVGDLAADHVIMEGTYCGEPEFGRADRRAAVGGFLTSLAERIDSGGSVLVPAFSLGRAQELVGMLADWNEQTGRSVPIWTVGLVNKLNEVSAAHPAFLPGLSGNPFARAKAFPIPRNKDATEEERRIEYARVFFEVAREAPCVVIASHGMLTEGTGSYLIARAILAGDDPRHAIFLCGYMDPRTPGFRLRHQCDAAIIDFGPGDLITRKIPVERIQFHRLTAHASYEELVDVALSTSKRSITFIHGDGEGLDGLIADLQLRLNAIARPLSVRAPAIGERILIDRVRPPPNWDIETSNPGEVAPPLGPGRWFDRKAGLSIRGLTADRRWALIPIGLPAASLSLENDRIDASRIDRLEIRPERGTPTVVFDRATGQGNLSQIALKEPDKVTWRIKARDPGGQVVQANLVVFCGAEIRAVRTALDAGRPTLDLQVGGCLDPQLLEVTTGQRGDRLDYRDVSWEPIARLLRIHLRSSGTIGAVDDVQLRIRWPNGFTQYGPSLGGFTFEPRIDFEPVSTRVGASVRVPIRSTPAPVRARVANTFCAISSGCIEFAPTRPGIANVEFEYATLDGGCEWREAGSLQVHPAATLDVPRTIDNTRDLEVTIRDVDPHLFGVELALSIDGKIRDTWTAGAAPHTCVGGVPDADPLDIAVLVPHAALTLVAKSVGVYSRFELDRKASLTVTTADGQCEAKLAFVGPSGWNRELVESPLLEEGFVLRGWSDDVLHIVGSDRTTGSRAISIFDGSRKIDVRIVTLSDLRLSLVPHGPYSPGDACSVHTARGAITEGLKTIDGGPLVVEAQRVAPLIDELSARVVGSRVHFFHPGRYLVSLIASGRRLAHVEVEITAWQRSSLASVSQYTEKTATSAYEASVLATQCPPCTNTVVLSAPRASYRILQAPLEKTEEVLWRFLVERLAAKENVLVSWPGLALGSLGGALLRRLRIEQPEVSVAHLSYPVPRGEIAVDEAHARVLWKAHRVLCCARASSTIDRLDAYRCVRCDGTPRLKTDTRTIWQECANCGHSDRDLVLTLVGLRSTDVRVLFADYRISKYLSRGRGKRYAAGFARSVRCGNCLSLQAAFATLMPWDGVELRALLEALTSTWNASDQGRSVRQAAYLIARRARRSSPSDVARLEDALGRLIDAGVYQDGKAVDPVVCEKLEAGVSLCCSGPLVWSDRRLAHAFLDIEDLLDQGLPTSMHPELAFGQAGVRALLSLSE